MNRVDGYVTDVRYPAFFYKEMQPLWLMTVAGFLGSAAPDLTGDFALCELGCGVGANLLVAAACHPHARFVGVDFNAAHLDAARDAAATSGIDNVEFIHADFASFANGTEHRFDVITCHGVWSWVAPEERARLLGIAARCLAPDGLLYLHYMCHPGSTELAPVQQVLNLCAHHMPGPSTRQVKTGLELLKQLVARGAFAEQPMVRRHLVNMAKRDPADLAHEFLTDHWHPERSADLHQQVGEVGLCYLGSADVFNNLDVSLSVPGQLQALVGRAAVPALAETLKDIARNAHQRMDLFQKQPRQASHEMIASRLNETRFAALPDAPARGPATFATPIGSITGPEAIFTPLLERLAAGPASGAELARLPALNGDAEALLQSLQLLMMEQMVHPLLPDTPAASGRADRLERWFAGRGVPLHLIPACATAVARRATA